MDILDSYSLSIVGLGFFGLLTLVQLLVADIAGLKAKHIPGSAITGGHDSFLFRASRAHANTNESIGIFILLVLFVFLSGANPTLTASAIWSYLGFRLLHALFYYLNIQTMRSVVFGLSLLCLLALFVIGILA